MAAYMHDSAAWLQRQPEDISWVVQVPYGLFGGRCLSSTGPTADFTSALSLAMAHTATVIECIFLEAQHAHLCWNQSMCDAMHAMETSVDVTRVL